MLLGLALYQTPKLSSPIPLQVIQVLRGKQHPANIAHTLRKAFVFVVLVIFIMCWCAVVFFLATVKKWSACPSINIHILWKSS